MRTEVINPLYFSECTVCCVVSRSTRILLQFCTRTTLVWEWRVVNIPNEDSRAMDVATLFRRILDQFYDSLEPFVPTPADYDASIRAAIGVSQQGDFQDLNSAHCVRC